MTEHAATVFIVDDDPLTLNYCKDALAVNFHCRLFENPQDVVNVIDKGDLPDIFLVDIIMPVMNGIQLCQAIRDRKIDLPIVIITGSMERDVAVNAVNLGVFGFVDKPINTQFLLSKCNAAASYKLLKDLNRQLKNGYEMMLADLAKLDKVTTTRMSLAEDILAQVDLEESLEVKFDEFLDSKEKVILLENQLEHHSAKLAELIKKEEKLSRLVNILNTQPKILKESS